MQNRQLAAQLAAREPDGRRPVVMHHRWDSLLFLHWTVPAESIRKTLPSGLTVDTRNEKAYLGITVFFMQKVRLTGFPPFPWFSAFQELNVRTYVVDRAGVPGVWFYSLDCNQPLAVVGARASTGLPYFRAKMTSAIGEYRLFVSPDRQRPDCPLPLPNNRGIDRSRTGVARVLPTGTLLSLLPETPIALTRSGFASSLQILRSRRQTILDCAGRT